MINTTGTTLHDAHSNGTSDTVTMMTNDDIVLVQLHRDVHRLGAVFASIVLSHPLLSSNLQGIFNQQLLVLHESPRTIRLS